MAANLIKARNPDGQRDLRLEEEGDGQNRRGHGPGKVEARMLFYLKSLNDSNELSHVSSDALSKRVSEAASFLNRDQDLIGDDQDHNRINRLYVTHRQFLVQSRTQLSADHRTGHDRQQHNDNASKREVIPHKSFD